MRSARGWETTTRREAFEYRLEDGGWDAQQLRWPPHESAERFEPVKAAPSAPRGPFAERAQQSGKFLERFVVLEGDHHDRLVAVAGNSA